MQKKQLQSNIVLAEVETKKEEADGFDEVKDYRSPDDADAVASD